MDAFSHRTSSYGRAPLRIGVLINGSRQPAWVAEVLEQISKCNFARLELAVWNAEWALYAFDWKQSQPTVRDRSTRKQAGRKRAFPSRVPRC
jgi:hypothetical protein